MNTFTKYWHVLTVLTFACVGAVIVGIESATGYLAWYTERQSAFYSPTVIAVMVFAGGVLCVLRVLMESQRSVSKPLGAALCLAGGAALSAIVYSARVYGFVEWFGHLPPLQAAMAGFVLMGTIGLVAVSLVAFGMKKR